MLFEVLDLGNVKIGAACGIAPTLRTEREEWGTHFVGCVRVIERPGHPPTGSTEKTRRGRQHRSRPCKKTQGRGTHCLETGNGEESEGWATRPGGLNEFDSGREKAKVERDRSKGEDTMDSCARDSRLWVNHDCAHLPTFMDLRSVDIWIPTNLF